MKTAGNVFGIFVAWLLSIVLVIMLMITPIATSALSLVNAKTITNVVIDILMSVVERVENENTAADYQLNKLSNETSSTEDATSKSIAGLLESYLGVPIGAAELEKVMSSNTVKEILTAYTGDLTGVLTGEQSTSTLNAEKLQSIVNANIDEVVEIVKEIKPDLSDKDIETLKSDIMKVAEEKAEEIISVLPKPEEIKEQLVNGSPEIGSALKVLEKKKTIELALAGVMAGLCVLIFLCRMGGFRGLRWLAVDLFIGGGFNALVCLGLKGGVTGILNALDGGEAESVVGAILAAFTKALLTRSIIILAVGAALLAAYIVLKKMCAQKVAVSMEE